MSDKLPVSNCSHMWDNFGEQVDQAFVDTFSSRLHFSFSRLTWNAGVVDLHVVGVDPAVHEEGVGHIH